MAEGARNPTGSPLPQKLIEEAQRLNVPIADRSEEQVRQALREAWLEENSEAIQSWNAWVREHGLPLDQYRRF